MLATAAPVSCDTVLTADYLLTDSGETLCNAAVAVAGGRILALGPRQTILTGYRAAQCIELGEALIMPGLINAHTHASMTLLRGLADDLPLMTWLQKHIFPVEQRLTRELCRKGALLACAEMTRAGVTAFVDMYLLEDAVFEAAAESGLRMLGGEVLFSFPSPAYKNCEAALDCVRRQAEIWKNHSRVKVAVMPHAVYTTTPKLLEACRDLAATLDLPLHIHLAETPAETEGCCATYGKRPLALCREAGLLGPRTILAHCVDLTDEELDLLAESGAVPVHCPRSNMKLASGISPVPAMLKRGIPVALGTDGAASNNALNMFLEMGTAALLHKIAGLSPTCLPASSVLGMATQNGAFAMQNWELGRLKIGGPADIIALDLTAPGLTPLHSPISNLVYAATGHEVTLTMVEGEILYHNGEFTRLDIAALREDIRSAVRELTSG